MSSKVLLQPSARRRRRHQSAPEVSNGPASLCETCRKAHYAALRDDGPSWVQCRYFVNRYVESTRPRHVELIHPNGETHSLPEDTWPNLPRLLDSAQAGCGFCAFLREALLSGKFDDAWKHVNDGSTKKDDRQRLILSFWYAIEQEILPTRNQYIPRRPGLRYLIVKVTFDNEPSIFLRFELEATTGKQLGLVVGGENGVANFWVMVTDDKAVAEWLALAPPATRNYGDEEIITFLAQELKKITISHGDDQENADFFPERLIDVGFNSLRLVEWDSISVGSAKRPEYCAFSYCWGPCEDAKSQTKSTSANLQHNLENLVFDDLSPVLKDAVKTTRSLCIPYLWVDSLCILQDDISDWQRQCSQMDDIYGNALVTLIAASSRTCREGFLSPKKHGLRLPYQSARRPDISGSLMMYFTHAYGEDTSLTSHLISDLHHDLTASQWARRGWTFQEDAMANARIVFGSSRVYFGCHNDYVSMDGPAGSVNPKSVTSFQSYDELHRGWEKILHRYSAFTASSFTNPTDLLPALSGLARLFGNILQDEYLAGHWAENLHCSLMWSHNSDQVRRSLDDITNRHGQKPYLIPSWSCLTRGEIVSVLPDSNTSGCRSEINILELYMPMVGEDPYGAIENACLTLEGFVLDLASLSWSESPERLVGSSGSHVEIWLEDPFCAPKSMYNFTISEWTPATLDSHSRYRIDLDFYQAEWVIDTLDGLRRGCYDQLISQMTMLLVGCGERYEDNILEHRFGYGLILVPLDGLSERCFLRVGTFYPTRIDEHDDLPRLQQLMKKETINIF